MIEEIKGPLDCAIDLLASRIDVITIELNTQPPSAKSLQQVLQGSVMALVNAGPLAIADYFLSRKDQFPVDKIDNLIIKLTEFGRKCFIALRLNNSLIDESTKPHHEAMVEYFNKFAKELTEYGLQLKMI